MHTLGRFHILTLAALAATWLIVFGLVGAERAAPVSAQPPPAAQLEMDFNLTNGGGPCAVIDPATPVLAGSAFQVGLCLTNFNNPPGDGTVTTTTLVVDYPGALVDAPDVAGNGTTDLDSNPDWNQAGSTVPGGGNWDCNSLDGPASAPNGTPPPALIVCATSNVLPAVLNGTNPALLATLSFNAIGVGGPLAIDFADTADPKPTALLGSGSELLCGVDITCVGGTIMVLPAADLVVTKTGPAEVLGDSDVTWNVNVENRGPSPVENIVVIDLFPSDKVYNDADSDPACSAYPSSDPDINVVICGWSALMPNPVIALGPGEDRDLAITAYVPPEAAGKPNLNVALATATNGLPPFAMSPPDPDFSVVVATIAASPYCQPVPPQYLGFANICAIFTIAGSAFPPSTPICGGMFPLCDNVDTALTWTTNANVTASKVGLPNPVTAGSNVVWTVTLSNAQGASPAVGISVTDTVDADQLITGASGGAWNCGTPTAGTPGGNSVTCTLAGPIDAGTSNSDLQVTANVLAAPSDITCSNDVSGTWADPSDFHTGTAAGIDAGDPSITCLAPNVQMYKDKHPLTLTRENVVNLWLCQEPYNGIPAGFGGIGNVPNTSLNCTENGEGRLVVGEVITNVNDPEGAGAYEFQIKFDHKIFDIEVTDTGVLYSTGRVPGLYGGCLNTIINENSILFGCVSKDPDSAPPITLGPKGSGTYAMIELVPEGDLKYRLTPGQQNGVVRKILDENCELADIYGDPLATASGRLLEGILPGGLVEDCDDLDVTVRILEGDLNLDCAVTVVDDQMIAYRYGASFGNLLYDPWFDLEPALKDFDIDIKDLQKVFGRNGSVCSQSGSLQDGTIPPQVPLEAPY
jgi:uncharacterized repeat protein (TIGR01451 family)